VHVHDAGDKTLGNVMPYSVYDVSANVGVAADIAELVVASLRC
jgi:hypothetical protein